MSTNWFHSCQVSWSANGTGSARRSGWVTCVPPVAPVTDKLAWASAGGATGGWLSIDPPSSALARSNSDAGIWEIKLAGADWTSGFVGGAAGADAAGRTGTAVGGVWGAAGPVPPPGCGVPRGGATGGRDSSRAVPTWTSAKVRRFAEPGPEAASTVGVAARQDPPIAEAVARWPARVGPAEAASWGGRA